MDHGHDLRSGHQEAMIIMIDVPKIDGISTGLEKYRHRSVA